MSCFLKNSITHMSVIKYFFRPLDSESIKKSLQAFFSGKNAATGKSYSPEFVRLIPPLLPLEDEVIPFLCFFLVFNKRTF